MSTILHIDTSTELASVCLSVNKAVIQLEVNTDPKNHGSFLQPALKKILYESSLTAKDIDAIAIANGPGSYTGLRVGLSTAKGLCYAWQKPLIVLNTLQVMANAALLTLSPTEKNGNYALCPMIDARRMEVFTAAYTADLQELIEPQPKILQADSFKQLSSIYQCICFGSGSKKFSDMVNNDRVICKNISYNATHMIDLANALFTANDFGNLAYTEPFYLKEFYSGTLKD